MELSIHRIFEIDLSYQTNKQTNKLYKKGVKKCRCNASKLKRSSWSDVSRQQIYANIPKKCIWPHPLLIECVPMFVCFRPRIRLMRRRWDEMRSE